jgi:hypothetical protein
MSSSASAWVAAACVGILAIGSSVNGCGSDSDSPGDGQGGTSRGASGGLGASGGASSGASGGASSGASGGPGGACAKGSGQTALQPLDMFIMFDRSTSMRYDTKNNLLSLTDADCNTTQSPVKDSRWCKSVVALSAYLNSPASGGNRAALQFFGESNQCDGTAYSKSVQPGGNTGYTNLPTNLFDDDLNGATPDANTPLEGAIRGLIAFTGRAENRTAGRRTINVLITDADTSTLACSKDINMMQGLLDTHFRTTGVPTYVIGMTGADFGVLETLATGGNGPQHTDQVGAVTDACGNGAGPCRSWNVGNGNGGVLTEALKGIQQTAVGCTLRMPKPATGTLDLNQVEVDYSPGGNPPVTALTRVTNSAACVATGFYYDNNTNPSTIELCPEICKTIGADPKPKIEVVAACVAGATAGTSGSVDLK